MLDSPCSSLVGDSQTVQVGLLPSAAPSLLQLLVDVAGQEGASRTGGRGVSLAVVLRVPLIGDVVGVFGASVLVSYCRGNREEPGLWLTGAEAADMLRRATRGTWGSWCCPWWLVLVGSGHTGAILTEALLGWSWDISRNYIRVKLSVIYTDFPSFCRCTDVYREISQIFFKNWVSNLFYI